MSARIRIKTRRTAAKFGREFTPGGSRPASNPGEGMRISTALAAVSIVLVAVAITGCSSSGSTTPAAAGGASSGASSSSTTTGSGGSADIDACTLLTVAQASTLTGASYTSAAPQRIAKGQDVCTYTNSGNLPSMVVTVYQSDSGASWKSLSTVLASLGAVTDVSGVGDKAIVGGGEELDAQVGDRYFDITGAGALSGNSSAAVAVSKAIAAALH